MMMAEKLDKSASSARSMLTIRANEREREREIQRERQPKILNRVLRVFRLQTRLLLKLI